MRSRVSMHAPVITHNKLVNGVGEWEKANTSNHDESVKGVAEQEKTKTQLKEKSAQKRIIVQSESDSEPDNPKKYYKNISNLD